MYVYHSERADLTLQLSDNYEARNQMLSQLQRDSNNWFELALSRAPMELHSTLQVSIRVTMISIPYQQKYRSTWPLSKRPR